MFDQQVVRDVETVALGSEGVGTVILGSEGVGTVILGSESVSVHVCPDGESVDGERGSPPRQVLAREVCAASYCPEVDDRGEIVLTAGCRGVVLTPK